MRLGARRLLARLPDADRREMVRLAALTGLFFLVICAIGILRPIKNAVALGGLGDTEFYRVYVVSAAVVAFVPLYNWLGERVRWRRMIVATAVVFAAVLLLFRASYREGSALYGLLFYGWYDLLAAVMVTQFFMATQLHFDARTAKEFYPWVIAGGSLGATAGGLVTGAAAGLVGVPNLILLAALLVGAFALAVPFVTGEEGSAGSPGVRRASEQSPDGASSGRSGSGAGRRSGGALGRLFGDAQVRLITVSVLLTVLVKQLVDYQFNTISAEVYVTTAAISEFQGWFNAATQWLPLAVLVGLRPLLQRWGVGLALFLLPVVMVGANVGLALSWSLAAAVAAKAGDTGIRYAAERTAREILYVPVPEDLKMRAKGAIDVAVEKGLGKALSALLIFGLLAVMDHRRLGWVAAGLALASVGLARAIHSEYVRSLARSFRDRAVSLKGLFASLADATTLPVVRGAFRDGDPAHLAFTLDLLAEAEPGDLRELTDDIAGLLDHPAPEIRERALELVAAAPAAFPEEPVRARLADAERPVREAAARAWVALRPNGGQAVRELLASDAPAVRRALLACVSRGEVAAAGTGLVDGSWLERRWRDGGAGPDREARLDVALAAAAIDEPGAAAPWLTRLLGDPDPEVASAALRSAGRLGLDDAAEATVRALASAATRRAASDALIQRGPAAVELLGRRLGDAAARPEVRRHVPAVLAGIRCQASADALLAAYAAPETDQLLDYRTLKALNKLRSVAPPTGDGDGLAFEAATVRSALDRELAAARRYARATRALAGRDGGPACALLRRAVGEAWERRRESVFRCLGLLFPPDEVYRCYLAVVRGERRARASALEWLEESVGRGLFARLGPVLGEGLDAGPGPSAAAPGGPRRGGRPPADVARPARGAAAADGTAAAVLRELGRDKDRWITRCAVWAGAELGMTDLGALTDGNRGDPADDELRRLARRLERGGPDAGQRPDGGRSPSGSGPIAYDTAEPDTGESPMNLVQRVFLLQHVDLLRGARSEHLALVASVSELVEAETGAFLLRRGEPPDAMFVVVEGSVELRRGDTALKVAGDGDPFGTWALVDEEPSVVDARAAGPTTLLRIARRDFQHLLADNPELALGLLQGLSRRVRDLVRT